MRNPMTSIRHPSPTKRAGQAYRPSPPSKKLLVNLHLQFKNFTNEHLHHIKQSKTHKHTITTDSTTFSHPSRRWMPFPVPRPTRCTILRTAHRLPPSTRTARGTLPLRLKQQRNHPACPLNMPSHARPSARL